jgi:hypothetical protein
VTPSLKLSYDYEFVLGIKDFQEDIVNSVIGKGGYIDAVKSNPALTEIRNRRDSDVRLKGLDHSLNDPRPYHR